MSLTLVVDPGGLPTGGYRVEHRDLAPGHVEHLASMRPEAVSTRVSDARQLDLGDGSVDAVLLLGPLWLRRLESSGQVGQ